MNNQGDCEMWMPLHAIQDIHKTYDKIMGTRYGNLPKHVTIQKWDIKQLHPSDNHLGVSKPTLQQDKNHVWIICTITHMYHKKSI